MSGNDSRVNMVEVFRTNVTCTETADKLIAELLAIMPDSAINFDLEDSENILRVECENPDIQTIIFVLRNNGFECEVLE